MPVWLSWSATAWSCLLYSEPFDVTIECSINRHAAGGSLTSYAFSAGKVSCAYHQTHDFASLQPLTREICCT